MKIIHTADWHIGNTFYGYDRSDEHRHFLDFLLRVIKEHEADALVVAGDVFDNPNPSAEAQHIYYDFLSRAVSENPGLQIVVIAGNHDSAARLEASSPILEGQGVCVRGCLHTDDKGNPEYENLMVPLHSRRDADDRVVCLAVPFLRQSELPREDTFSKSMGKFFKNLADEADGLDTLTALSLSNAADGADYSLASLVDLSDLEANGLLDELAQLCLAGQIGLGCGDKHADALDIDDNAALVLAGDNAFETFRL